MSGTSDPTLDMKHDPHTQHQDCNYVIRPAVCVALLLLKLYCLELCYLTAAAFWSCRGLFLNWPSHSDSAMARIHRRIYTEHERTKVEKQRNELNSYMPGSQWNSGSNKSPRVAFNAATGTKTHTHTSLLSRQTHSLTHTGKCRRKHTPLNGVAGSGQKEGRVCLAWRGAARVVWLRVFFPLFSFSSLLRGGKKAGCVYLSANIH